LLGSRAGKVAAWNKPQLLEYAVYADHPGMVKMLLDAGASPNQQDQWKRHMLMAAATNGASVEVVAMLLNAGASLEEAWRSIEKSPLVGAAAFNSADVVRLLLERLVNAPNAKKHLDAALRSACAGVSRKGERVEVAQILLDAGASFNGESGEIHALLYQVVQLNHHEQLPLDAKAAGNVPRGRTAIVQFLLKHKADVNHDHGKPSQYPGALFAAACTGQTDMVRLLLEAGAKHDLRDKEGRTPLQHAVRNEYKEITSLLRGCSTQGS